MLRVLEIVFVRFYSVRDSVRVYTKPVLYNNPNTSAGLVGKVRRRKEGRMEKKAHAARPPGPGLKPVTCRVLGEGPQLHARGAV